MATSAVLSNPTITVNSVSLTDQCTGLTPNITQTALRATAFGDTSEKYQGGLFSNEITCDFFWSEAASETYATLAALLGTTTNVVWKATSAATSATNVQETLTGCYLETISPVYALGELSTISVVFKGGVYSVATS